MLTLVEGLYGSSLLRKVFQNVSGKVFPCMLFFTVLILSDWHCCQLLANYLGQIIPKIRPLAKKFGRTHYFVREAFFKHLCGKLVAKKLSTSVDWQGF
jgi:hypothetical protein